MSWFSNPDCPKCGRETEATGYAGAYPQFRCRPCMRANKKEKQQQSEMAALKARIAKLEGKQ